MAVLRARYLAVVEHTHTRFGSVFATTAMLAAYQRGRPWRERARRYFESQIELAKSNLTRLHISDVPIRLGASFIAHIARIASLPNVASFETKHRSPGYDK